MAWQEPKTDWSDADALQPNDTNRIESNIEYLAGNGGEQQLGKTDDVQHADITVDSLASSGAVSGTTGTFSGSVVCASINTGSGAFEIGGDVGQNLRTSDSPTFASMTVNNGAASAHYTGSTANQAELPVGSIVLVFTSTQSYDLNETIPVFANVSAYTHTTGTAVNGTWKCRGSFTVSPFNYSIVQRIS